MNFGLYRDDGLGYYDKMPGPALDKMRKNIIKLFQRHNLKITIATNLTTVDFLDTTMNVNNKAHKPYRKQNNEEKYVHIRSNHPPNVIKTIPKAIEKRLISLSDSEETFKAALPPYQEALKKAGTAQN